MVQTVSETAKRYPDLLETPKKNELLRYLKSGVFWVDAQATMELVTKDVT